jgi:glucose/arabinose dehydrogenase
LKPAEDDSAGLGSLRVHPPRSAFTALILLIALHAGAGSATVLPSGFVETEVADGLVSPTVVSIAPDGRIFIAEQSGRARVVRNGGLLVTPLPPGRGRARGAPRELCVPSEPEP